ncbi:MULTISPECIES: serine hydrolase domain-containing protein [Bizionia]|nr:MULTISPECIES: serine hydrolase [Bizionia]
MVFEIFDNEALNLYAIYQSNTKDKAMKINFIFYYVMFLLIVFSCSAEETAADTNQNPIIDTIYFPPIASSEWNTKSLSDLNWNETELTPLLDFLVEKNSKSFMILHNGKIVIEQYFNDHTATSPWYWASAGKTLTTATFGIAQDAGLVTVENRVSDYLGVNWTSLPLEKENLITCQHLLSMTSGLDDTLGEDISPENLQYIADAGTRWAYHNVYVNLQNIIENASSSNWDSYFNSNLKTKIGMSGQWIAQNNSNVYWSNTRSMARFGLLMFANGNWNNTQILSVSYINNATNTSQNINEAYGYLWWLNGNSTYHLPQTQFTFSGSLIPNAPTDMIAALGKNDQKIYIVPSMDLVIVRMGESSDESNFGLSTFDAELWDKINAVINN